MPGPRGCYGRTRRKGPERFCKRKAKYTTQDGRTWCSYHLPKKARKEKSLPEPVQLCEVTATHPLPSQPLGAIMTQPVLMLVAMPNQLGEIRDALYPQQTPASQPILGGVLDGVFGGNLSYLWDVIQALGDRDFSTADKIEEKLGNLLAVAQKWAGQTKSTLDDAVLDFVSQVASAGLLSVVAGMINDFLNNPNAQIQASQHTQQQFLAANIDWQAVVSIVQVLAQLFRAFR